MQAEEAVEIDHSLALHRDGGTQRIVIFVAVGDDDVEAVGCPALEDGNEDFLALRRFGRVQSALEPQGSAARAGHCERGIAEKYAACRHVRHLFWNSGEPIVRAAAS